MFAPWEGSTTRSGDGSDPGADNMANVSFTFGALNWSETAEAVGTAVSVVSSWMAGETVGRVMVGAGAMTGCRSNVGDNPGAICATLGVEDGDPFTAILREERRSVTELKASD